MTYPYLFDIGNMLEYCIIDANNMYSHNKSTLNDNISKSYLLKRADDNLIWSNLLSKNIVAA